MLMLMPPEEHYSSHAKHENKERVLHSAWKKAQEENKKHRLYTATVRSGEILGILELSPQHMCPRKHHSCLGTDRDMLCKKWNVTRVFDQVEPDNPSASLFKRMP